MTWRGRLRGWCSLKVEEYDKKDGTKGKANKVAVWVTDKPKLARAVTAAPADDFDDGKEPF